MILYDPNQIGFFHTTACITIREAKRKGTIKNFRQVPDGTTLFRIYGQRPERLFKCPQCDKEEKSGKTPTQTWNEIKVPEINNNEILPDCFLLYTPESPSKIFHFMKCSRVCEDEKNNHLEGYRFTNKAWFEDFNGNVIDLKPCPCCLAEWNNRNGWENFSKLPKSERRRIYYDFCIDDFFRYCLDYREKHDNKFPSDLEALYELMYEDKVFIGTEIKNDYPTNWKKQRDGDRNKYEKFEGISSTYRRSKKYCCEDCGVDLSFNQDLCVAHHINGCHFDVRPENIRVLCKECHKKKPYHKYTVNLTPAEENLIQTLRQQQGIIP